MSGARTTTGVAVRAAAILTASAVVLGGAAVLTTSSAAAPAPGSWRTSFESTDPAALASTVEKRADGTEVRNGIVAGSARLPGSVIEPGTPVTASAENPPAEVAANLADADPRTKWLAFESAATITYRLPKAAAVATYALTSGNDAPDRDPASWRLQGSTDGTTFNTVDTRTAQTFAKRGARNTYTVTTPKSYGWYRLDIAAPQAGTLLQLADLDLAAKASATDENQPMVTGTGNGPTGGLNLKQNAGFTGLHAYRYAGRQTVAGRAYETNVVQRSLSVKVGPTTRLSYKILPEDTGKDEAYPSTYAAVDLHFTDGTYLSQLKPVDQHGVALTARGQGTGKILYVDQWNAESADLGAVANGKTVDRVLLAYDAPNAKAGTNFAGWLDDVSIAPAPAAPDASTLTNLVDTRRGTNASGSFSRGNNLPISAVPNGFTFLTPVTDATSNSWEYYYAQANDTDNHPRLQGFSVSHEPSPWMGDRNQLSVMPSTSATPTASPTARALAFTHDDETARPDLYSVRFTNGLKTELTPSDHGAVLRFTFPGDSGSLVFDTVDEHGSFVVDQRAGTVHGWVDNGSGLSVGRSRMFFTGTFSTKPTATGTAADGNAAGASFARFGAKTVELRLATSFIGLGQAQRNADLELSGRTFEAVHKLATQQWQRRLGVVEVGGATAAQRSTLYGSLYRLNLYPNAQFENTGTRTQPDYRYASPVSAGTGRATDTYTAAAVKKGRVYVNNGFWDTYRTVWPAYSLLYPEVAAELVDGFVQQYRDGGWVARWSSPGYADLMTGTSSDVAFAGAYLRGVPLKDPLATYDAALKNATTLPASSGVGRKGLATSQFRKYTDTDTGESVSWQLEGDINDAGLAQMAAALATDPRTPAARRASLRDEAAYFGDRAGQYVNLFDPSVGFFQGREPDGSFAESKADYDPGAWGGVYTETDGWNFAFHAPQDGQGLADLYGGRAKLADKLDQFFATPELADKPGGYGGVIHEMVEARAVRMGQFGMSNQVSHHIPYMYDYVQQPYKTQKLVREVLQRLYVGDEIGQGYPGDEDNGEMSAWYVLSSLGIYPLQSGSPNWAVGSPLFDKVVVHRSSGDLTITAKDNSTSDVYVQGLQVNGRSHASTSISTAELAGDARLDFTMGAKPSTWGTGADDVPPSPTTGATAPAPEQDATGTGTLSAAGGQDVTALTDDDSRTQATFTDGVPTLTWTSAGAARRVDRYTLTSGSAAGDPSSWTLQGSSDGESWTTLDSRTNEQFPWRGQTRPFTVADPGSYPRYRLVFTGASTASLAEVELLVPSDGTEPARAARAATPDRSVAIAPTTSPGATATVTGTGFTPGERVQVALATPRRSGATLTADAQGRISGRVSVPAGTVDGVYALTATGARSNAPATATTAVADPALDDAAPRVRSTLVLSSTTATAGERVTASGTGYRPNRVVTVSGTTSDGGTVTLGRVRANADGVFTTVLVMPAQRVTAVTTDSAAAASTPRARTPFRSVTTPHGTSR